MDDETLFWRGWADRLQQWGLADVTAGLLEGLAPLLDVGAQLVYLSQPVLSLAFSRRAISAFARLLEKPEARGRFVTWLRTEKVPKSWQ